MSLCNICDGPLSIRGGGICIGCRTAGEEILQDTRLAVLGYCLNCGGRLRGKGKGYCPSASKGICKRWTNKQLKIPEALDDLVEEKPVAVAVKQPPRQLRKRSLEAASMFNEDPLVHRRRVEFLDVHAQEQRLMGRCDLPCP